MSGTLKVGGVPLATHTGTDGTGNPVLDSGVVFPAGHIVKTTKYNLEEYAEAIGTAYTSGNKQYFEQIGSESWDVTLAKANSDILILGYFTMGNAANIIHFDMKVGGTGGTFIGAADGMSTEHRPATEDKMNVGISFLHDPGTQAEGTTLTYVPYVGATGTMTLHINNYSLGYAHMEMVSHFIFLEVAT